jgi:L-alanine-DL-glutamate epimerase-like enolase superfamily enzyme
MATGGPEAEEDETDDSAGSLVRRGETEEVVMGERKREGKLDALAGSEPGHVKITAIKAMQLREQPQCLVRVDTDAGICGYGEAGTTGPIARAHLRELEPFLIGQDPMEIEKHFTNMTGLQHPNMPNMPTISGVDIALWDLAGKILDRPVSKLLSGRFRDAVRLYINITPQTMFDRTVCREWAEQMRSDPHGWRIIKMSFARMRGKELRAWVQGKPSRMLTPSEIRLVGKGYANAREALGDEFDLIIHCHNEWDLPTATNLCRALEPIEPLWIEDPLAVVYSEAWKALKLASPIRILTGEKLELPRQFLPFLANGALDAIHPDVAIAGGITGCRKIADLADLFGVPVATHNVGSLVHNMASAHFGATVRNFVATESRIGPWALIEEMGVHDLQVADGHIAVPDRPGLGVELVEEVLRANLEEGEPYWD